MCSGSCTSMAGRALAMNTLRRTARLLKKKTIETLDRARSIGPTYIIAGHVFSFEASARDVTTITRHQLEKARAFLPPFLPRLFLSSNLSTSHHPPKPSMRINITGSISCHRPRHHEARPFASNHGFRHGERLLHSQRLLSKGPPNSCPRDQRSK